MVEEQTIEQVIFEEARKLNSGQAREACLKARCGEDEDLRGRVEALLGAYDKSQTFLETPPDGVTIEPVLEEQPGTVIGPYKLLQQIGEGGMGVVFMAEQAHPVQRTVALKIIKPGMDTRQVIARFEAERQALAMMDHPNIAHVLDAGTTETGRPYFVMELVKGVPITKYCDEKQLSVRKRLELFKPVCEAVQHAHQKGIIHRDIKPTNVLVAEYDNRAVPKIIDFGVAKATAQKLTERTMFTEFGQVIGTVEYMSPEQAKLNQLDIDTRSDIYSLGVLLYELLTGSTPFEPKRLREAAFDEVLRIIRDEEPPKPSTRLSTSETLPSIAANRHTEPARLSKDLRGDLDWIVMKALEKDRTRRYDTASKFAEDVQHYLNDEAVSAWPPSAAYRFRKFAKKNKSIIATVAAIAAALVIGTCVATWQAIRAADAKEDAQLQAAQARAETAKAKTVIALLRELIRSANPDELKGVEYTVRAMLDEFSVDLQKRLQGKPEVKMEIFSTIGKAYWRLGMSEQADPFLREALDLKRQTLGKEHEETAHDLVDYAWNLFEMGRLAEAEERAREALTIYRKRNEQPEEIIKTLRALQEFIDSQGDHATAVAVANEALDMAREFGIEQHPELANILHVLSRSKYAQGEYAESFRLVQESLSMHRQTHGEQHVETAHGYMGVANGYRDQGDYVAAESNCRKALFIFRKQFGSDHWTVCSALNLLGSIKKAQGDYSDAETQYRTALVIGEKSAAKYPNNVRYHFIWASSSAHLVKLFRVTGQHQKADETHHQTLNIYEMLVHKWPEVANYRNRVRELIGNSDLNAEREDRLPEETISLEDSQKPEGTYDHIEKKD
jgi:serine/threonine protein kinase